VVERFVPESLPRHDFRVLREQAPERDERAVGGASRARRAPPIRGLEITRPRALDLRSPCFPCSDAILTKARHPPAGAISALIRDDRIAERALSLAAPHEAVDIVGAEVVLHHAEPECARARIARARERRRTAREGDLARLIEAWHVRADHVLEPTDD